MSQSDWGAAGVNEGDVLAGKYRVTRVLGIGGVGVVVAAHHLPLDMKVAIKLLRPEMLANRDAVDRFAREAKAAARITGEHVPRVLDVGVLETGAPFMVVEFLDGGDLAAWLTHRGRLVVEQAVEFVVYACVALAEAHGLGIVHRDLKPSKLFCIQRPDGQLSIKVLDFGISNARDTHLSGPGGMPTLQTAASMGSPFYLSPEQMQSSQSADAQSDIWALGIILYELLAGRVPFSGESVADIAARVATLPAPSLRAHRSDVSPELEAAILKCLEKDRARRHRNVAELAVALAPFAPQRTMKSIERITGIVRAGGHSIHPMDAPHPPDAQGGAVAQGGAAPAAEAPRASSRGVPVIAVAVGVIVIAMIGVAAVLLRRSGHASEAPTELASASATPPAASGLPPSPVPVASSVQAIVPAAASSASRRCDPPFTLDAQHRKRFKPGCAPAR